MPRRKIHCWTRMSRFGRRHLHGAGCGTPSRASGAAGHNRRLRSLREKGPRDDDRPGWVVPSTVIEPAVADPRRSRARTGPVESPSPPGPVRWPCPKRAQTKWHDPSCQVPSFDGSSWHERAGKKAYQSPDQPFGLHRYCSGWWFDSLAPPVTWTAFLYLYQRSWSRVSRRPSPVLGRALGGSLPPAGVGMLGGTQGEAQMPLVTKARAVLGAVALMGVLAGTGSQRRQPMLRTGTFQATSTIPSSPSAPHI